MSFTWVIYIVGGSDMLSSGVWGRVVMSDVGLFVVWNCVENK